MQSLLFGHNYLKKTEVFPLLDSNVFGWQTPFTAVVVPGLADLFLVPLSTTGSSSTSFSARELRLLGPLGFSAVALGGPVLKTTTTTTKSEERKHKYAWLKRKVWDSSEPNTQLRTVLFFLIYQIMTYRLCCSSMNGIDKFTDCVFVM